MEKSMTQGSIAKALVLFTIPLVLSGMLQQMFNWVDAFIVGNVEGELALAGIGATTAIYNLFVMVLTGLTGGLSVLAAQNCGMGDEESLGQILWSFVLLLGAVFLAVAALGMAFVREILLALDTSVNIFDLSMYYLRILFAGIPFLAVYNTYSAVLRGMGNSRAPFLAVLVCSGVNVVLDVLLVAVLRWGVTGAAVATVVSQGVMTVFLMCYTRKRYPILRFRREQLRGSTVALGGRFGLPPAIQSGLNSAGSILLQRFMNGFDDQTVAAITTAYRIDTMLLLPVFNFGSGISTVVAQNIGTGNPKRAKQALGIGTAMIAGISLGLTLLILFAGEFLIAIFGLTAESVAIGGRFFRTLASFYVVFGLATAFRSYLEGLGDMAFSGAVGIFALGVRIVCSYAFEERMGRMVIAYAEAFSWAVLLGLYVLRCLWKIKKQKE